jgi:rubrerythrin
LVRAVRYSIAAEYEAMQLAESTDNKQAKALLVDIANEEREHVGEFLALLRHLAPDEAEFYKKKQQEVEEILREIGDRKPKNGLTLFYSRRASWAA